MRPSASRSAFTLIELLVVIAIIAILAVVVVLTLNPAQLLAQSRDANRVSDMATLNSAINLYSTDQSGASSYSLGSTSTAYLSLPASTTNCSALGMATSGYRYDCSNASNYRNASSSGWLPIAFNQISSGAPFGSLPVDPVNQSSSNLYYSYETNGSQYVLSSFMESQKYAKNMQTTGGIDPALYEIGSGVSTLPNASRGLVGYWPLNEGTGNTAIDWSGNQNTMSISGIITWVPGKTSGNALNESTSASINISAINLPSRIMTVSAWVNISSFVNYQNFLEEYWPQDGGWNLFSGASTGGLVFGVSQGGIQYNAQGCQAIFTPSTWHYIVGVYNGLMVSSYVDGVLCGTASLSNEPLSAARAPVGNAPSGGSYSINDLRLYDRALSASEIQQIYNAEK